MLAGRARGSSSKQGYAIGTAYIQGVACDSDRTDHEWQDYQVDVNHTDAAHDGVRLMSGLQAPLRVTGFR